MQLYLLKTTDINDLNYFFEKIFCFTKKICTNFGGRKKKRLTPDEKHVEWPDASNHKITA